MLELVIPENEGYDESTGEFISIKGSTLQLEHSLISLSKWESKWEKPYLNNDKITPEQALDYVKCMTLNKNVDPHVYNFLTQDQIMQIRQYIDRPMTATTIRDFRKQTTNKKEIVTSELIYYWMISLDIPFECEKWPLNRLLTLIKVCDIKNGPDQKMSKKEMYAQQRALNQARRARSHSKG